MPELISAYDKAKDQLLTTTSLAFPDSMARIRLTADASDFAIRAVPEARTAMPIQYLMATISIYVQVLEPKLGKVGDLW